MRAKGLSPVTHQRNSLATATRDLDALHADGAKDLAAALRGDPSLISEAANGRTQRAIQAMRAERELRLDAPARADRFVAEWQAQARQLRHHKGNHEYAQVKRIEANLNDMARSLHRDPQLESLLRNRTRELGLPRVEKNSLSHTLQEHLRPSRSRGLGI